ncbi:MAG: hypothetical protein RIC95_09190 [Vicingaceae bacterium]
MENSKAEKLNYTHLSLESEEELLNQRYISVITIFNEMKNRSTAAEEEVNLIAIVEELLEEEQTWPHLLTIEQCMVGLMSEDEISVEYEVLLIKARALLSAELYQFYHQGLAEKDLNRKKECMERLIRDVQWYGKILDLEKTYVTKTRIRTALLFVGSILLFFAVDQLPWLSEFLSIEKGDKGDAILTAVTSGTLGTCFSMLISLKGKLQISSLSDLRLIHRLDYIFSRALIGFVSGLILFYFFDSELMRAPIFPHFNHDGAASQFLDHENLALLVVWCFISGFSEKMVPDLLFKTEQAIDKEGMGSPPTSGKLE